MTETSHKKTSRRSVLVASALAGLAAPHLARPAIASSVKRWRMLTSWPKNSPGPGQSAERLAKRISQASGGEIEITVHGANEVVSGFEVFDAISGRHAEMAHTASVYWTGKTKAAAYFTTVPFGLTSREHMAWIYHGGGQELWDWLYEPFGIKPFMAGNTGMQMGGWFKKPVQSLQDLNGLKLRIVGFGGEIYRRMGASPVAIPAPEILTNLSSGAVDGAEFLGPWIDEAFGFYKAAEYYMWPGFNKPNGTGECLVARHIWEDLSDTHKQIISDSCMAEHACSLAEADWKNADALDRLVSRHGVKLTPIPDEVIERARQEAGIVMSQALADAPLGQEVLASYRSAEQKARRWASVGTAAYQRLRDL